MLALVTESGDQSLGWPDKVAGWPPATVQAGSSQRPHTNAGPLHTARGADPQLADLQLMASCPTPNPPQSKHGYSGALPGRRTLHHGARSKAAGLARSAGPSRIQPLSVVFMVARRSTALHAIEDPHEETRGRHGVGRLGDVIERHLPVRGRIPQNRIRALEQAVNRSRRLPNDSFPCWSATGRCLPLSFVVGAFVDFLLTAQLDSLFCCSEPRAAWPFDHQLHVPTRELGGCG